MSSVRGGDIVVAGDDESQSELLLLLMSGAEMTLTVLADLKVFLPIIASTKSRHVGSSLRLDLLLLLPLLQFMLQSMMHCDLY